MDKKQKQARRLPGKQAMYTMTETSPSRIFPFLMTRKEPVTSSRTRFQGRMAPEEKTAVRTGLSNADRRRTGMFCRRVPRRNGGGTRFFSCIMNLNVVN